MIFGRVQRGDASAWAARLFRLVQAVILMMIFVCPEALAAQKSKRRTTKRGVRERTQAQQADSAAKAGAGATGQAGGSGSPQGSGGPFVDTWLSMVSKTQAEQPHWVTPLVTVTPRLEQEFRYDITGTEKYGVITDVFGGGKGLEIIPTDRIEVILGLPAYNSQDTAGGKTGFSDETFLVKYRLFASNEAHSNQILTFFFGLSVPTGSPNFTNSHTIITPTLAYGKGFGRFDVQSTLSVGLPVGGVHTLGRPVAWNTTLQEHVSRFIWPELEFNSTFWNTGEHAGKRQLFVTPGLCVGRIPLHNRVGLTMGVGLQVAATKFHTYDHAVIFSFRLPF